MAFGHWMTNAGVADLLYGGKWATENSTAFRIGLMQGAQPAALDTKAEIQQLNWVSDFIGGVGATECNFTGYSRLILTRGGGEDDVNNRANLTVANAAWNPAGGAVNNTPTGFFIYTEGGGSDTTRRLYSVRWFDTAGPDVKLTFGGTYTVPFTNPLFYGAN